MREHGQAGRRRAGRTAFTLIELLAVVAIVGIMLAIAVPAFENFATRGLSAAAPELMSTLRLARQHAVTQRKYVWVVFPDKGVGNGGVLNYSGAEINLALHAYAVIEGDQNNQPSEYLTDWKFLPQGVYFDTKAAGVASVFNSYDGSGSTTAYYPFPNSAAPKNHNMPAIQFRPNGHAYFHFSFNGSGWRDLSSGKAYLMSAVMDVNTNSGTILSGPTPKSTNNVEVRVFALTGQIDFFQQ